MTPDASPMPCAPALPAVTWPDEGRRLAFERWLATLEAYAPRPDSLRAASADASFRRYLRLDTAQGPRIVMDAPPAHEDCRPFVRLARRLHDAGLHAPEVLAWNEAEGFLLLSDLGDTTYLRALDTLGPPALPPLYRDACTALLRLQTIGQADAGVPPYDRALLRRELDLFPQWYVERHVGATLTTPEREQLEACFERILANNLAQPAVLVHRDYHSRNLMLCGEPGHAAAPEAGGPVIANPGILDFQDAVWGPITYDLVSLLRDAYVDLDEEVQIDLAVRYWERARRMALPVPDDFGTFWRDLEWMGLQRHLKVLGIFARLYHRDGKSGYLADLPRVWRYAHRVCTRYDGLGPLARLLERLAGVQRSTAHTF